MVQETAQCCIVCQNCKKRLTFTEKRIYWYTENQITKEVSGTMEPDAEDSLENTLSCVPKVQGASRISQANGRRSINATLMQSSLFGDCIF